MLSTGMLQVKQDKNWAEVLCIHDFQHDKGEEKQMHCKFEPVHEISNNMVCATSKASDQPARMRSLIRAFASCLSILLLLSYWLNPI